jgi:tetratricopeptide (TPR) repeat protein
VSRTLRPALACAIVLCVAGVGRAFAARQPAPAEGLTGEVQLLRAYDAIFDARFDDVPPILARTCGPAPAEACQLLAAVTVWWQIQLDPASLARDASFQSKVDAAIAAADAWTRREPQRAEAWFYLGGAYGARAQWRVLRGERLGAARDGKRIKESLERALVLDPGLQEAYFGIGLYHYYAAVAPTAAKMLRWLLLLPGGDKTEGMQEMLRAREHGALLRDEADYQLQVIYLWYEKQPQRALDLLMQLRDRHPRNPLFPQLIAQVQDVYFHDLTGSLRTWRSLLDAARARRVAYADLAEVRARLGMASTLDRLNESDAAIEQLRAVIAMKPLAPFGAYAQAQRELTRLLARSRAAR